MRDSLSRVGQLSAVEVFESGGERQLLDGFKRLQAARQLGWSALQAHELPIGIVEAKLRIATVHAGRGLSELEEAWLVQSLYREDRLTQPQIGQRLGMHKSWVCRRLILAEGLNAELQAQVRLGLLCVRAAVELGKLSRDNQLKAAPVVVRRGLTVRQTRLLVAQVQDCESEDARATLLEGWQQPRGPRKATPKQTRSEADWISADTASVRQTAARLIARLASRPLSAMDPGVAEIIAQALRTTTPTLQLLIRAIDEAIDPGGKERMS
ncbi:MAG: hypothetical protein HY901_09040 [Deltaproteobacteria bacterium]|nr:hypothetical protein [Deltaproteobacteria bacterium]